MRVQSKPLQEAGIPVSNPRRIKLETSPVELARILRHREDMVFFDTALDQPGKGCHSIIAALPTRIVSGCSPEDWQGLRAEINARQHPDAADSASPAGFAAGSVDYDGAFHFAFYDDLYIFEHGAGRWLTTSDSALPENTPTPISGLRPSFAACSTREEFCGMVQTAREYIAAGDIYQVNLSHEFASPFDGDAWDFYDSLRHYSPAPYCAFLRQGGRSILSSSPEMFLRMSGRHVATRPIKGTRPRRTDALADQRSAYDLRTSQKEIAELVMITDLQRNDLGRVCDFGSVEVREMLTLEQYEHVFHLVSEVEGSLRPEMDHVSALQSCFPGGSITGAPKKRAREIIAELEGRRRGLYTGAIGYFGFNGISQFSIAIRTVEIADGFARFGVGAGIVADSVPEKEYDETLDKAAGILMAAQRVGEIP